MPSRSHERDASQPQPDNGINGTCEAEVSRVSNVMFAIPVERCGSRPPAKSSEISRADHNTIRPSDLPSVIAESSKSTSHLEHVSNGRLHILPNHNHMPLNTP
jgi:hypothetical protein